MTIHHGKSSDIGVLQVVSHPLDPLTAEEIATTSRILKSQCNLGPRVRFETIVLKEPDKEEALNFQQGHPISRRAFLVVLDNDDGATYEATVSLDEGRVTDWRRIEGVQPRIMFEEFFECETVVKANPDYRDALAKRGISDPDLVMVDPWSAGYYGFADEEGRRLALARSFLRSQSYGQRLRPSGRGPQRPCGPERDGSNAN